MGMHQVLRHEFQKFFFFSKVKVFGNFELSPMLLLSPVKGKIAAEKINAVNLVLISSIISYLFFFRPTVNAHFLIYMALIWKFVRLCLLGILS